MPKITLRVPLDQPNLSKKNEVKLAKRAKREPRKASIPWQLGLRFVQPINMHLYCIIFNFIIAKGNLMHAIYKFPLNFHAEKTISLQLDLGCL